nr:MAG TPA: hypothetical protein [Caudoviricetes sp.]
MFAGRIGSIYRSAVLLSTLYNILGICQNKKSRALSLPSYREDVAKDLLKIPQMLPTSEGSYPQTEGL